MAYSVAMASYGKKTALSWSSGKDSAWALFQLQQDPRFSVSTLITTLNQAFDRIPMHAVRRQLLEAQASALGLSLRKIPLPWPCSDAQYEEIIHSLLADLEKDGFEAMAFGDLFLEDVRAHRENLFQGRRIQACFPLWGQHTGRLARQMIDSGLRCRVTCVDPRKMDPEMAGRCFDEGFLNDLPADVDPCGENGEFHTFCWDGPMFQSPVGVEVGEVVERDGFVFCDLRPSQRHLRSPGKGKRLF